MREYWWAVQATAHWAGERDQDWWWGWVAFDCLRGEPCHRMWPEVYACREAARAVARRFHTVRYWRDCIVKTKIVKISVAQEAKP